MTQNSQGPESDSDEDLIAYIDAEILPLVRKNPRILKFLLNRIESKVLRAAIGNPGRLLPYLTPVPALEDEYRNLAFAGFGLFRLINCYNFQTVLDIGSGAGDHAAVFERNGKSVVKLDLGSSDYFQSHPGQTDVLIADINSAKFASRFDCVWVSHVLEHQPNVHKFLLKLRRLARRGGLIAITVPPLKFEVVGGHLSLWTPGHLIYNLAFAGIDCRDADIMTYGYNITVIVRNLGFKRPKLKFDTGDIELLRPWLPSGLSEGICGYDFLSPR